MWSDLLPIGRDDGTGGYRRYAWTREDATLREWFVGEAHARGLDVVEDRVGNQYAWWGDVDAHVAATGQGGVVTGSHLDSVPDGGAFDGPLGVVSGFAAVDALRTKGITPARPVAVANVVDEEGARFGVACAGSRVLTGAMTTERALGLADADGVSMAQALRSSGRDPQEYGADEDALRRIGAFVELHVEQGQALGDADRLARLRLDPAPAGSDAWGGAVAVGTSIHPHGRWRIDLPGLADHAGTTALADRSDAMLLAAEVTLAVRAAADRHGCVATVGRVEVTPNGINAIPSHVRLWLDTRGADTAAVRASVAEISARVADLGGRVAEQSWTDDTPFTADLTSRIHTAVRGDRDVPLLSTGAGHDAGVLATAGIPSAMLFVRNPTGVSHSPAEFAEESDCITGVDALTTVLEDLVT
ncbi:allantoate amidohydrolase [Janibacter alittae]|uniref:Allantoate amidohydrolase n=1 Tax=Janibacter alittae TaxID=3115209 RepID=A0ABZ2MLS8_9MICO